VLTDCRKNPGIAEGEPTTCLRCFWLRIVSPFVKTLPLFLLGLLAVVSSAADKIEFAPDQKVALEITENVVAEKQDRPMECVIAKDPAKAGNSVLSLQWPAHIGTHVGANIIADAPVLFERAGKYKITARVDLSQLGKECPQLAIRLLDGSGKETFQIAASLNRQGSPGWQEVSWEIDTRTFKPEIPSWGEAPDGVLDLPVHLLGFGLPFQDMKTKGGAVRVDEVEVSRSGKQAAGKKESAATTATPPTRILLLGDSLTAQGEGRLPLARRLKEEGYSFEFVGSQGQAPFRHEGHGGFTIGPDQSKPGNLSDRVGVWIPAAKPDVIFLLVGNNDYNGKAGVDPSTAPARLEALVRKITTLAPDSEVIVSSVLRIAAVEDYAGELNRKIPAIVETLRREGRLVRFANLQAEVELTKGAAPFNGPDSDYVDGTHLNAAGGKKLSDARYTHLVPLLHKEKE